MLCTFFLSWINKIKISKKSSNRDQYLLLSGRIKRITYYCTVIAGRKSVTLEWIEFNEWMIVQPWVKISSAHENLLKFLSFLYETQNFHGKQMSWIIVIVNRIFCIESILRNFKLQVLHSFTITISHKRWFYAKCIFSSL